MGVMDGVGRQGFHLGTPLMFTTTLDVKTTKEGHELRLLQVSKVNYLLEIIKPCEDFMFGTTQVVP